MSFNEKLFHNKCIFIRSKKSEDTYSPNSKYKDANLMPVVEGDLDKNLTMLKEYACMISHLTPAAIAGSLSRLERVATPTVAL